MFMMVFVIFMSQMIQIMSAIQVMYKSWGEKPYSSQKLIFSNGDKRLGCDISSRDWSRFLFPSGCFGKCRSFSTYKSIFKTKRRQKHICNNFILTAFEYWHSRTAPDVVTERMGRWSFPETQCNLNGSHTSSFHVKIVIINWWGCACLLFLGRTRMMMDINMWPKSARALLHRSQASSITTSLSQFNLQSQGAVHPCVSPDPYDLLSTVQHKWRNVEECTCRSITEMKVNRDSSYWDPNDN